MTSLIPILIAAVGTATILNVLLRRINMPTVVGYIITGAIISSLFQIDSGDGADLQHVAEFGVVFLMFTIGLEFSFSHLKSMKKEVFLFGTLQVVLSAIAIASIAYLAFGFGTKQAIIVGSALSLSSTAIVLKILNESGQIKSPAGRNSLGILIFQDIAVIPILLMITIFTSDDKGWGALLGETALNAVIAVGFIFVIGRYVLGHLFRVVSDTNSKEIYMGTILLTVIGASYVAHYFGFSYSLGGFLAGMMIADTIYRYQIEADLIPFRDLLLGVFFVSVGMQLDLEVVSQNMGTAALLALGLMLLKTLLLFLILLISAGKQIALKTALVLAQIGEFSLVVFSMVLANQMMDSTVVQIMMVAIVVSMIVTPVLVNHADDITRLVFGRSLKIEPSGVASLIDGYVVLLGYGYFGQLVSQMLDVSGIDHVIVTNNIDHHMKAREHEKMVVYGDATDKVLLQKVGIQNAMSTIIALDDVAEVKHASASISLVDAGIEVIAKVPTEKDRQELEDFDLELVLDGSSQTAGLIVDQINKSRMLAKERSELRYISSLDEHASDSAIDMIALEQKRLLDLIADYFNGMREGKDIMSLKALHESFKVLSSIIGDAIKETMRDTSLSPGQYEQINTLVDNQDQLVAINGLMEELSRELKQLAETEGTRTLAEMAVEGLDAILLTLIDLSDTYNNTDMELLQGMTAHDGGGLARIRQSYLDAERNLGVEGKSLLVRSTNHMDRLRSLFGKVGDNYQRLAELRAPAG